MTRLTSRALIVLWASSMLSARAALPPDVPTASQFLKINVGADGVLATYDQIVSYWKAIDASSDRITIQELGPTTLGHPYIVAIITSPENQKNLEHYREINNRLYDPRRTDEREAQKLIAEGKTIVAIQCAIHSTEVGAPQLSLELAYRFATENTPRMQAVLDNTIIILSPSHNPDGTQMVAEWNQKTVGTKFEGVSTLPFLYHHYVGHDDNRDWYMFTQKESQITVAKIWNYWHPQISYDLHQMGQTAARIFAPPYVDPADPNVDPILRAEINALGSAMAARLIGAGKDGVVIHAMYDMWTPARAYVNYHGGVRMLTEVASARLASPIKLAFERLGRGIGYDAKQVAWNFPRPWRGGTWRLRDIIDYEHIAVDALLDDAAQKREQWLANFYRVNKNAIGRVEPETGKEKPFAIIIPAAQRDLASTFKLLWVLQFGDVEINRAKAPFVADGRQYEAGSHVILISQPAGTFAKTLSEVQQYPDLRQYPGGPPQRPYDVTAWTMPLLMGVDLVSVQQPFEADLERVTQPISAPAGSIVGGRAKRAYVFAHDNAGILALNRLAKANVAVYWATAPFKISTRQFDIGSMIVPVEGQKGVRDTLIDLSRSLPLTIYASNEPVPAGRPVKLPRVGLYKSFVASMDEGWTRWIFEQWGIGFVSLGDKEVRAGGLRGKYDAIVLPDQAPGSIINGFAPGAMPDEYVGGIGPDGVTALKDFVDAGGTLIALDSASLLPIREFKLPVVNTLGSLSGSEDDGEGVPVARSAQPQLAGQPQSPEPASGRDSLGPDSAAFYAPGSIVRAEYDVRHPVAYGSDAEGIVWFEQSPAFEVTGNARPIATYPAQDPLLLSGWLLGGEKLKGKAAVVEVPMGKGRIVLFGFRPQYRAQTWSTFKLLFNALYYSTMPAEQQRRSDQ